MRPHLSLSEKKKPRFDISTDSPLSIGLPHRKLSIREIGSATARDRGNISQEASINLGPASRSDINSSSKLPAVTTLINLKPNHSDPEMRNTIIELTKYAQSLEQQLQMKDKEIQRLEVINKYLNVSLQHKEQLVIQTMEENRRLKNMPTLSNGMTEDRKFKMHKLPISISHQPSSGYDTGRESLRKTEATNFPSSGFERRSIRGRTSSPRQREQSSNLHNPTPVNYIKIDDINEPNHDTDKLVFLNDLIRNEDIFMKEVPCLDRQSFFKLYDAIQTLKINNNSFKTMIAKLKRILKASISMATSLVIIEAIERVVEEVCSVLNCDRATVWIYDRSREELWSQAAKGSDQTIRVPADKGIVGQVFTQGELLNILNAYAHEKFNKAIDIKTGYKTNTILAVPIKDENDMVVGVVQAINKLGTGAVFSKDDESLCSILANLSGVVLRNSISYNQQLSLQNILRSAVNTGITLSPIRNINDLIPASEKRLKDLIKSEKVRIALKTQNASKIFILTKEGQKEECPSNCGIMGKVISSGEILNVPNGYSHGLFNGLIDIETSLPLYCMPIKDYFTENVIGAIQIINTKGIQGLAALNRVNIDPLDLEALNTFASQLSQAIKNCYEWDITQDKLTP